jgi:hypothetical protein
MSDDSLPETVVERVTQLTRWARRATEPDATEYRDVGNDYSQSVGTLRVFGRGNRHARALPRGMGRGQHRPADRIDNLDRGVEQPLEGSSEDWAVVNEHNRELAATIDTEHGPVHGANALALAEFAGNHYGSRIEHLSKTALTEFLTEYFPRNVWPSAEQKDVVEESIRLTFDATDEPVPAIESVR